MPRDEDAAFDKQRPRSGAGGHGGL